MKIITYKTVDKGATKGYITLFVPKWELTIYNITHYAKDGKEWISFPSKSYEKDGQTKWFAFMRFEKPEMMEKFQTAVLSALKEYQGTQAKLTSTPATPDKSMPLKGSKAFSQQDMLDLEMDGLPF